MLCTFFSFQNSKIDNSWAARLLASPLFESDESIQMTG